MSQGREEQTRLEAVGARIRQTRERQELNLHELARLCGISASALSLIETGKRDLRITSLCRIADALRVKPGRLFEAEEFEAKHDSEKQDAKGYDLGDYQ